MCETIVPFLLPIIIIILFFLNTTTDKTQCKI